jgi:intracellular septation protein A
VMDVILPVATFNVLNAMGASTLLAIVAGGIFPLINIARGWIKTRQIELLGIIVISFLAIGTAAALISGSIVFALVRGSLLTATFGLLCLGSLFAKRPLTFHLIKQMVAGHDPVENARWNALYEIPSFRRMQRFIAAVWGTAYIVEALVRVTMALTLEPALVVNLSPVMGFGLSIGLALWTRSTMLAARARRLAEAAGSETRSIAR